MPTDPIKLINKIYEAKQPATAKPAEGAAQAAKADPAATAKTGAQTNSQAAETAKQAKAYVVDQNLKAKMSAGGGDGTRTLELARSNAKDVQAYYETAAKTRKAEAASSAKSDPLQGVLSDARGKTGNVQFSPEAQASLNKSAAYKEAQAARAAESKSGISKSIGTA